MPTDRPSSPSSKPEKAWHPSCRVCRKELAEDCRELWKPEVSAPKPEMLEKASEIVGHIHPPGSCGLCVRVALALEEAVSQHVDFFCAANSSRISVLELDLRASEASVAEKDAMAKVDIDERYELRKELVQLEASVESLRKERDAISKRVAEDECKLLGRIDVLEAAHAEATKAEDGMRARKDAAYEERNCLVALVASLFPASLERHPDEDTDWEDDWRWVVYVDLPSGQASWHIHDTQLGMFDHLPRLQGRKWDGHTTLAKYARIAAAIRAPRPPEAVCANDGPDPCPCACHSSSPTPPTSPPHTWVSAGVDVEHYEPLWRCSWCQYVTAAPAIANSERTCVRPEPTPPSEEPRSVFDIVCPVCGGKYLMCTRCKGRGLVPSPEPLREEPR